MGLCTAIKVGVSPANSDPVPRILTKYGMADFSVASDYSNCWQDEAGTTPAGVDQVVGRIVSGSYVATQPTAGFKPILRHKFSYAGMVSSVG